MFFVYKVVPQPKLDHFDFVHFFENQSVIQNARNSEQYYLNAQKDYFGLRDFQFPTVQQYMQLHYCLKFRQQFSFYVYIAKSMRKHNHCKS